MRNPCRALVLALVALSPVLARAADETAAARAVYEDVNARTGNMKKVQATARAPGVEYDSHLTAWLDATGVRKVLAVARDDSGDVEHEFYYDKGALHFVYHAVKGYAGKKQVTRVEHRYYFRNGALFRWLAGLEKAPLPKTDPEFATTGSTLTSMSGAFLAAVQKPRGSGPKTVVGTFVGVEQGDYAHLQIKLADGTEDSFFVLHDDGGLKALMDAPKKFAGRKVEVQWEEREENIPEAGGPQSIRIAVGARLAR